MKEITMFVQKYCPHCILAKKHIAQLRAEDSRYSAVQIREIDESEQSELANSYDYWYVPSFYLGNKKLHEGHAEYEDIKKVFDAALFDE
ncbi:MAG: thioredoxin [Clostridiales bacterium]|jgi:predicted DsbA family dithiol-disulfide isomerase|nr:thioredoxin [Clostridiales bacterium]